MSLTLVTPPSVEPLLFDEVVPHLRLDADDFDEKTYVEALIVAARETVEAHTSRALITQTWALTLDDFPVSDQITLPKAPLSSVTSIAYVNSDGDSTVWDSSNYVVNAPSGPRAAAGVVSLAYDAEYPTPRTERDAVTVTFVAGYGTAGSDVPGPIKAAMQLLVAELYARREVAIAGVAINEVPLSVSRLLASYVSGGW